jgi:hypothetical protein
MPRLVSIMVTRFTILAIGVGFFLSTCLAMAQMHSGSTSGHDMLRYCGIAEGIVSGQLSASQVAPTAEEAMIEGFCVGAVAGVRFLAATSSKNSQYPICVPEHAPKRQVLSVVVRYLHNHPERLNDDFLWIIMDALREAWRCAPSAQNPVDGQSFPKQQGYVAPPQTR